MHLTLRRLQARQLRVPLRTRFRIPATSGEGSSIAARQPAPDEFLVTFRSKSGLKNHERISSEFVAFQED
jgi:hypothetical protein